MEDQERLAHLRAAYLADGWEVERDWHVNIPTHGTIGMCLVLKRPQPHSFLGCTELVVSTIRGVPNLIRPREETRL